MMRKICICDGNINMLFAQETDRRMIYDISVEDKEIVLSMFSDIGGFKWEDIRDEKSEFFDECASMNKYLFIEYNNEIIGIFYHTHHLAAIDNVEFHIWFVSKKHTGKGLGTRVVSLMKEYIHKTYGTTVFLMRPWIKNPQAVRTYEKCGFKIVPDFVLADFFTPEEIEIDGNGAYSEEETVNMVANIADNTADEK